MKAPVISLREYKRSLATNPSKRIAAIAARQHARHAEPQPQWQTRAERSEPTTRRGKRDKAEREAAEIDRRFPDESHAEHAKRLGLIGETRGGGPLYGCNYCADLPWRRRKSGCPGCGLAYRPEVLEHAVPTAQSNIARCWEVW